MNECCKKALQSAVDHTAHLFIELSRAGNDVSSDNFDAPPGELALLLIGGIASNLQDGNYKL